ncbi:MAG: hypothetical protein HDR15_00030 [Lachnospiraceae bacterium]|nr:hypothetical protein [Lachnospiraceae bacterium]
MNKESNTNPMLLSEQGATNAELIPLSEEELNAYYGGFCKCTCPGKCCMHDCFNKTSRVFTNWY